jgi:hypothetical protein
MCTVFGEEPFKVASHEHRPQLVLVGNVELIAENELLDERAAALSPLVVTDTFTRAGHA